MCGGAGQDQKDIAASNRDFAGAMRQSFEKRFAGQNDVLVKLNSALTPTLAAGPGGRGLNPTERRLAEARIADRTAANYQNAARAVGGQLAGRGGDSGLMSGVDAQIKASLAGQSAKEQTESQTQLELSDFEAGRANYNTALQGMTALSGQYDPTQFGSLAGQTGDLAFNQAKDIDKQKGGFWKTLGGIASAGLGIASNLIPGGSAVKAGIGALGAGTTAFGSAIQPGGYESYG
jgi:hypothetical protein